MGNVTEIYVAHHEVAGVTVARSQRDLAGISSSRTGLMGSTTKLGHRLQRLTLCAFVSCLTVGVGLPCVSSAFADGQPGAGASAGTAILLRGGWLGAGLELQQGRVRVVSVNPAATGARIGLQVGDVLASLNGTVIVEVQQAVGLIRALREGQAVDLVVDRSGRQRTLRGAMVARPLEEFDGAVTSLGAVPWGGGYLRSIMVMPTTRAPGGPVVYFVQGVSCATIESSGPGHPYAGFVEGLVREGIAVFRVEKAGVGDSTGSKSCSQTTFEEELTGYEAGYRALRETHGVTPEQLIVFGHSMGGIQVPRLFQRGMQARGVAVFGVGSSPWLDYLEDVFAWQPIMQGGSPADVEALSEQMRPLITALLTDPAGALAISTRAAEYPALMRDHLGWDGADNWLGRSSAYWRGVAAERSYAAWGSVNTPVLAVHGGKDLAVIDDRGARRIAFLANARTPGSGSFVALPDTNHDFTVQGGLFDPELAMTLTAWIKETIDNTPAFERIN
jgi:pimeloyl-ACP methyl ester carboxylesterase